MQSATEPDSSKSTPTEWAPTQLAQTRLAKRRLVATFLSVALHVGLVASLVTLGMATRTRVIAPVPLRALALVEYAGGSHSVKLQLPSMETAARTRKPAPSPEVTRKTILPVEQTQPKVSGGGAPVLPQAGDGSSDALRGNGSDAEDARPAFAVFSPHPPVHDRSLLPATEEKVVVDVKLDAMGQVVSETLVTGTGNRLDQIVLDIVRTWRFQPATVNGKPVPAEAELIFPFNRSYPITNS